jgi:AAA family ATPase
MIDKALMRPGRLDRIVYVRLPDKDTRKEIFNIRLKSIPLSDDVSKDELVEMTERYSGAELVAVCNEAALLALENDINSTQISRENFLNAIKLIPPRINQETISYFDNFSFK